MSVIWKCIYVLSVKLHILCFSYFFLFGLVGFSEPQLKHFIIIITIIIIIVIVIVFIFSLKHQLVKLRGQIKKMP